MHMQKADTSATFTNIARQHMNKTLSNQKLNAKLGSPKNSVSLI